MLRKLSILICCILMIMTLGTDAFAASSPEVYADKVTISGDEDIKVPVSIKNNSGLMGFHFTLKYDADKVTVTNVTNSDLTSTGLFNQNLNLKKGKFDVVWSGSQNMSEQGPLFYIYIRAKDLDGDASIKMSYVEEDTFDESLQNVTVDCNSIKISKGSGDDSEDSSNEVVEGNPEEDYLTGEISEEVTSHLDEKDIISIIYDVAQDEGLDSIKDLTPEQARKIIQKIKEKMEEEGLSTKYLDELLQKVEDGDDLDSDSILTNAVKSMYESSAEMVENKDQSFEVQPSGANKPVIVVVVLVLAAIVAGAIILFFRRKKK